MDQSLAQAVSAEELVEDKQREIDELMKSQKEMKVQLDRIPILQQQVN